MQTGYGHNHNPPGFVIFSWTNPKISKWHSSRNPPGGPAGWLRRVAAPGGPAEWPRQVVPLSGPGVGTPGGAEAWIT